MLIETLSFKVGGKKYRIGLDDGYLAGVHLPDGTFLMITLDHELPLPLASSPRFHRFLAQRRAYVREMWEGLEEDRVTLDPEE